MAKVPVGVRSGTVMTVHGPIAVERMGTTLMHEHILLDASKLWNCPCRASELAMADKPVSMEDIGELRMNPFVSRDNCLLLDVDLAVGELSKYYELGGDTVVDPTNLGIGRDPEALQRIARRSRLNVVMGSGFYLEPSHPDWFTRMDLDEATAFIVHDVGGGDTQPDVMAGIIGEVGVSKNFTEAEKKSLRAAARASRITGVPLSVHLPGWERLAHEVLDIVEQEGADLNHTVLCHMNPSGHDPNYQLALARRGAFLEYDMIGMDYYYAEQDAQSPSDEENARAIRGLIDKGFGHRVLMSQDVFLKIMLTRYGGFGYAYILKHFVPRLKRHGIDAEAIDLMLKQNPVRVFSTGVA